MTFLIALSLSTFMLSALYWWADWDWKKKRLWENWPNVATEPMITRGKEWTFAWTWLPPHGFWGPRGDMVSGSGDTPEEAIAAVCRLVEKRGFYDQSN